ncbi:MAG: glycosyltransferase family 39 protein [Planctomycetes bacterium]|nr:glycosyltransferase family 39 protein [Planctomycetota bacterium]
MKSPSAKTLITVMALGAIPAVLALLLDDKALQQYDIYIAAVAAIIAWFWASRENLVGDISGLPIIMAVMVAIMPTLLSSLTPGPVTNDERAYFMQAELFAEGQLSEPLAEDNLATVFRRRQVYEDEANGVRFSKYSPGTSIALIPSAWFGWPLFSTLMCALIDLWLVLRIAQMLNLKNDSRLAMLLFAVSPFFMLLNTSWQSEVFSLTAVLAAYYGFLRSRKHSHSWGALVGAACGMAFAVRPLTGLVFAAIMGLTMLRNGMFKQTLFAIVGGMPFLMGILYFNQITTGDMFTATYELYAAKFGPFDGNREVLDVYGNGDMLDGLLRQFGRWSVAFGGILGAIALAFWGAWRLRVKDGGVAIAAAIILPLAYSVHWYAGHRLYLGPLYVIETLPLLTIGFVFLLRECPERIRRALPLAMLSFAGIMFVSRFNLIQLESVQRAEPQVAILKQELPPRSIVFLPPTKNGSREKAFKHWTPSRPGELLGDGVVVLRTTKRLTPSVLIERLQLFDRALYAYDSGDQSLSLIE